MADRTTKVRLSAEVQGFVTGMQEATRATRETGTAAEKLAQQRQSFELMGRAAMAGGGLMLGAAALATKAAVDWESAWAGVTKTVDGTPEQLAAVESGLRSLAKELPSSHEEIAAVAEAAGQLGVQTPHVVAFTRTMIDLGETTNLAAGDAATQLARFTNIMGTSQAQVSNLGSALVELGNNYATTEAEIMEMSMRLAGAGKQIGMSEGDVLGLSTALSSVGIEAEAGGSAMSKVMIDIAASAEKGGARLEMFAKVAGMSADTFAQKWKADPGAALAAFVKGLANAESQGTSTLGVLDELGITEVRMRDALLRSASASDQFATAMETGNRAFKENTALAGEAEKRYETTAAKLEMVKNQITDTAISLGEHLLPVLNFGADAVGTFTDKLGALDGPLGAVAAWGTVIVGTGVLGAGLWMAAIPKIAEYQAAMETLGLAGGRTARALGRVGQAAGALGALVVLQTTFETLGNQLNEKVSPSAEETANAILTAKDSVEAFAGALEARMPGAGSQVENAKNHVAKLGEALDMAAKSSFWNPRDAGLNEYLITWRMIGEEIATVAATDMGAARDQFLKIANGADLSREQMGQLISESDALKDALVAQATAAGLAQDEATLLALLLGETGAAAENGADGAEANTEALSELESAAAATQDAIADLADEIRGFGDTTFDMRDANRRLEDSYKQLSDSVAASSGSFDISSEAGRSAEAALDDVARATNEAAAAILEETGSQDLMNAKLAEGREALINILAPYYGSRDAAAAYVDTLGLISPQKVTEIVAKTETAQRNLDSYLGRLNSIPSVVSTEVRQIQALVYKDPAALYKNANGGVYENGIKAFAAGGFEPGIYPYTPGGIHKFAEEFGEAYISMDPARKQRSVGVWQETGRRLGVAQSAPAAPQIKVIVNAATGMDENRIVDRAVKKIERLL